MYYPKGPSTKIGGAEAHKCGNLNVLGLGFRVLGIRALRGSQVSGFRTSPSVSQLDRLGQVMLAILADLNPCADPLRFQKAQVWFPKP